MKGQQSLLLALPQQSVMDGTKIIAQIIKISIPPLEFFDGARKIFDDMGIGSQTLKGSVGKGDVFFSSDGG